MATSHFIQADTNPFSRSCFRRRSRVSRIVKRSTRMADLEGAADVSTNVGASTGDRDPAAAAAAAAIERVDDAKSMSLDEFRHEMFRSLRDSGTVEAIRVRSLARSFARSWFSVSKATSTSPPCLLPSQLPLTNVLTLTMPSTFDRQRHRGWTARSQAQLRRRFIENLQQHNAKERLAARGLGLDNGGPSSTEGQERALEDWNNNTDSLGADARDLQWSGDEKLVNGLLFDYFDKKALEHSAAVFVPEIGGVKSYVAVDTILQESAVLGGKVPLVVLLLRELSRVLSTHTMDSGTQTVVDCVDHRLALEHQLRRVETAYMSECENQKTEPVRSVKERMLQYQREYDALGEKRLQEELERFQTTELALMRVEERKKYEREADKLRAALLQDQRQKTERLQERERDLELAFVAKRTELETSLFETRQSLFQEAEKLRVKEARLQAKVESDFRAFAAETKRLQLWEETVRAQESNTERLVAQAIREKEHALHLERSIAIHAVKARDEELVEREAAVAAAKEAMKGEKLKHRALQEEASRLEEALATMELAWKDTCRAVARLEKEKQQLEAANDASEAHAEREKSSFQGLSASNARLAVEKELLMKELERQATVCNEQCATIKELSLEMKEAQQQLLAVRMDEASALVSERKRFIQALDEHREQFHWKESELLAKLRDLQSRLAESEAAVEKFHSQYEDEKLHVASLRQEVANLSALLSQAQASISAKHGSVSAPRGISRMLTASGSGGAAASFGSGETGTRIGDATADRMLLVQMMEMMQRLQPAHQFAPSSSAVASAQYPATSLPVGVHHVAPTSFSTPGSGVLDPPVFTGSQQVPLTTRSDATSPNAEEDERAGLKLEQQRIERELLEQREYERRRAERRAQEEREAAERKRTFDEELTQQRLARLEEDERLDNERRKKLAAEEEVVRQELERQRRELQDATDLQRRLASQRAGADDQRAAADERAHQERLDKERTQFEAEIAERKPRSEPSEAAASDVQAECLSADERVGADPVATTQAKAEQPEPVGEEPAKTATEEEEEKKCQDATMDVYRQRVLARKAAEKQRLLEEAAIAARKSRDEEEAAAEEQERVRKQQQQQNESEEEELELSGGSFAESRYDVLVVPLWYSDAGIRSMPHTMNWSVRWMLHSLAAPGTAATRSETASIDRGTRTL
ncbi:hypothetical protein PybrP1_010930 [[Pythium] brassicae (nom. inval.)]|nr:hypothetical protein PybrP1_010930 [[Pythium] brassicae (nom. inval.)]